MGGGIPERCYYASAPTVSGSAAPQFGSGFQPNCLRKRGRKRERRKIQKSQRGKKKDNEREVFKCTERLGEVEGWRE